MKQPVRRLLAALVLTAAVLVGLPRVAAAATQVPVSGTLAFHVDPNPVFVFPFLAQHNTFSGTLTVGGQTTDVTGTAFQVINVTNGTLYSTFEIVTADGDQLFGVATGTIDPAGDVSETFTITGGTGAFRGARGSGTGAGMDIDGVPVEAIKGTLTLP
jgi:hypothetical protein